MNAAMNWIEIGSVSDIPRRGARVVKVADGDIAVFRTGNDEIYALRDRCPHAGGPLSAGIVHDRRVTCPLHGQISDLGSGQAQGPEGGCARTLPVRVANGTIRLGVET